MRRNVALCDNGLTNLLKQTEEWPVECRKFNDGVTLKVFKTGVWIFLDN